MLFYKAFHRLVQVSVHEVIVYHIYQEKCVMDVLQKLESLGFKAINKGPVVEPGHKGLFLPHSKGLVVDDGRLNNFFALEHAPGDSVNVLFLHIQHFVSFGVNGLVTDPFVFVKMRNQEGKDFRVDEELNVGLLEDVACLCSPAVNGVGRLNTINFWLRVDGEKFVFIHKVEDVDDLTGFHVNRSFSEGELLDFTGQVIFKDRTYFIKSSELLSPELLLFFIVETHLFVQGNVGFVGAKSWGFGETPSSVGEFIPLFGSCDVTIWLG